ncbi:hypothetical protein NESM_000674500 [Novymonas esmeraldas]|uniref:Uncharacterized protein n=1 Tax=Novymonas esmeraldas TaxID=1808958 RepID=A0AAW0EU42_9TRYP
MASEAPSKTAVNTRASLSTRLPRIREGPPVASASLHRKIETTYDAAFVVHPRTAFATAAAVHTGAGSSRTAPSITSTAAVAAAAAMGGTAADGTLQALEGQSYALLHHPTSAWESTTHAAARNVQAERPTDFYASARKIERDDDDRRGGLVGRVQRTLDIRTKRAEDANLRPPTPTYRRVERRVMQPALAQERFGVASNYLDLVECTQLKPDTEEQIGYDDAPLTRLPEGRLSQDLSVQSKIITKMGTSNELFRGTPKYLEGTAVSYAGHVPMAERNASCIHHGNDARRLFAKSTMTMAEHGGGVDVAVVGTNLVARHRGGKNAKAPPALQPKSADTLNKTVEGRLLRQTFFGTLERERQMNLRDDAQGQHYF